MMIKSLAIIGLGSIGRRHLRLISEIKSDIDTKARIADFIWDNITH